MLEIRRRLVTVKAVFDKELHCVSDSSPFSYGNGCI